MTLNIKMIIIISHFKITYNIIVQYIVKFMAMRKGESVR